jgi:hypothetical protein
MMTRTNHVNALKYFAHTQDPYVLGMFAQAFRRFQNRYHNYHTLSVDSKGTVYGAANKINTSWMADWTPLNTECRSLVVR